MLKISYAACPCISQFGFALAMCLAAQNRTFTEIQRLIGQKLQILPTPSHLVPSFGMTPFEFMEKLYGS